MAIIPRDDGGADFTGCISVLSHKTMQLLPLRVSPLLHFSFLPYSTFTHNLLTFATVSCNVFSLVVFFPHVV